MVLMLTVVLILQSKGPYLAGSWQLCPLKSIIAAAYYTWVPQLEAKRTQPLLHASPVILPGLLQTIFVRAALSANSQQVNVEAAC